MFLTSILDAVFAFVSKAVQGAISIGLGNNPVVENVESDLSKYATLEANYAADYADVAPFSHDGAVGRVLLVKTGGPLSQYLGLS